MFHKSGPAIIFCSELPSSMLVINQECIQSTQHISGPHQDGVYYSRKDYGWFLIGLLIFDFSSNLTVSAGHESVHTMKDLCKTINPPPPPDFEYIATWWHKSFSKLKKIVLSFTNKLFQNFPPPKHALPPWTSPTFLKIPILIWLYYILCNSGSYWMNTCRKYYLGSIQNY